jgi:hypothetical protein
VVKPEIHSYKHPHEIKKDKKVSGEPHPLDKHSGTGRGKEMRKGGAGKANWGTMKDDLKPDPPEKKEEGHMELEEKDDSLTLSELMTIKSKRELEKQ